MSADMVINFANDDESPLAITDARVKAIKVDNDQLSPSSAAVPGDAYFIRPSFTVVNKSNQRVTGFWVSVTNTESGRRAFYLGNRIEIEPQGSYSFTGLWRGMPGNIVLPGSPQSIVIKVLGVEFEDGDVWGDAPPPPPPPPPFKFSYTAPVIAPMPMHKVVIPKVIIPKMSIPRIKIPPMRIVMPSRLFVNPV